MFWLAMFFWVSLTMRVNTKIANVTKLVLFDEELPNYFSFENEDNNVLVFVDTIGSECVKNISRFGSNQT